MIRFQNHKKYLAAVLAILTAAGMTGTFAYANSCSEEQTQTAAVAEAAPSAEQAVRRGSTESPAQKDETVYVIAGADGSVEKIIVSDWLRNNAGSDTLTDVSDLKDIENVKSDAGYQMQQDGALVWDAAGDDLYYQGIGEKALPVDLHVTYLLDGKEIRAEDLAGKSGRVTIRYSYTNNQYQTVEINGRQEKIYVPFGMLTGLMLDNERFRNISVSNGKLIGDGDRTIVVGFALPGMQENLAIDREKLELPDTVEITADVTDFRLGMAVTVAANGLFNGIDTSHLDSIDELTDGIGQMQEAMTQLTDGSSQLYNGLAALLEKSGELVNGIHQLADGAAELKDGAERLSSGADSLKTGTAQLADGACALKDGSAALAAGADALADGTSQLTGGAADLKNGTAQLAAGAGDLQNGTAQLAAGSAQLQSGTGQLSDGLHALTQNNAALNSGAKQVFDTLLAAADAQIKAAGLDAPALTAENYADTLDALIASLDADAVYQKILLQVTAGAEAKRGDITAQVTAAVTAQGQPLTPEVQAMIAQTAEDKLRQAIADTMAGDAVQQKLSEAEAGRQALLALKAQLDSYNTFCQGLQQYTAGVAAAADGAAALKTGTDALSAGAAQVDTGAAKLHAGASALDEGTDALKAGIDAAGSGAAQLKAGAAQVDSGVGALQDGAAQLDSGAGSLCGGAKQLAAGTSALYDGILRLENGMPALTDGVTQLRDGAMQLSDGLRRFSTEGLQKLADAVNGDLTDTLARFRATVDVSRSYRSYAGIDSAMDGEVKFIYRTEEIGENCG